MTWSGLAVLYVLQRKGHWQVFLGSAYYLEVAYIMMPVQKWISVFIFRMMREGRYVDGLDRQVMMLPSFSIGYA